MTIIAREKFVGFFIADKRFGSPLLSVSVIALPLQS
jgi:hypothetical protein